jgi:hypothetical protein
MEVPIMFRWILLTLAVFVGSAFVAETTAEARPWGYRGGVGVYTPYGGVNVGGGGRYYNRGYYRSYYPRYYYNSSPYYYRSYRPGYYYYW